MKITLSSIIVEDQNAALAFYTEVLGFRMKYDIPMGEFRWLTVVSPEDPQGTELVLEPNANPASKVYQAALKEQGIPLTSLHTDDLDAECERLKTKGVTFRMEPTDMGTVKVASFDDTCGNWIGLHQPA